MTKVKSRCERMPIIRASAFAFCRGYLNVKCIVIAHKNNVEISRIIYCKSKFIFAKTPFLVY